MVNKKNPFAFKVKQETKKKSGGKDVYKRQALRVPTVISGILYASIGLVAVNRLTVFSFPEVGTISIFRGMVKEV